MTQATVFADCELIITGTATYDTWDRAWDVTDMEAATAIINGVEITLTPEQRALIDVTDYSAELIAAAQDDAQQRAEDRADWLRDVRMEAAE
jgi:hypothetical protein